jgi:hypothetical protein
MMTVIVALFAVWFVMSLPIALLTGWVLRRTTEPAPEEISGLGAATIDAA